MGRFRSRPELRAIFAKIAEAREALHGYKRFYSTEDYEGWVESAYRDMNERYRPIRDQIRDGRIPSGGTQDERDYWGVSTYQGASYGEINEWLRYGEISNKTVDQRGVQDAIGRLDAVFERTPPLAQDILVYRGLGPNWAEKRLKDWTPGTVIQDKAFLSTTAFPGSGIIRESTGILRLKVAKGQKVLPTWPVTNVFSNEAEVILPRGSKFRIIGVRPLRAFSPEERRARYNSKKRRSVRAGPRFLIDAEVIF